MCDSCCVTARPVLHLDYTMYIEAWHGLNRIVTHICNTDTENLSLQVSLQVYSTLTGQW